MQFFRFVSLCLAGPLFVACSSTPEELSPRTPLSPRSKGGADPCLVRRAALDIGSTTTRLHVADVNRCDGRLIRTRLRRSQPNPLELEASGGRGLSRSVRVRTARVLAAYEQLARTAGAAQFLGVGTSAFRGARNGEEIACQLSGVTGVVVRVISQDQEAQLGFEGAAEAVEVPAAKAVVWDVGGGSMEISAMNSDGKLQVYGGSFSSNAMCTWVAGSAHETPNPIQPGMVRRARAYAAQVATREVPARLLAKVQEPDTVVIGIGAIRHHADSTEASRADFEAQLAGLLGLTDQQIGGAYAKSAASDRLLILGFMDALGIHRVVPADVDLTDQLLVSETYWSVAAMDQAAHKCALAVITQPMQIQ